MQKDSVALPEEIASHHSNHQRVPSTFSALPALYPDNPLAKYERELYDQCRVLLALPEAQAEQKLDGVAEKEFAKTVEQKAQNHMTVFDLFTIA